MSEAISALHFNKALTPQGWRSDVRLVVNAGVIASVEIGEAARPGDERHALGVPGMANVHSHAFQRAMAGLAERRGEGAQILEADMTDGNGGFHGDSSAEVRQRR